MLLIEFETNKAGDTAVRVIEVKSWDSPLQPTPTRQLLAERLYKGSPPGLRLEGPGPAILRLEKP